MSCQDYYQYLSKYIDENDIEKHIHLGYVVKKMIQLDNKQWKLEISQGTDWNIKTNMFNNIINTKYEIFDYVVIAVGQHQNHKIPNFPGLNQFKGLITHSNDYINAKPYINKKVLIIGGGDSAADIVKQVSDVSYPNSTYASLRHGAHVAPRYFGHDLYPLDYAMHRFAFYLPHFIRVKIRDYKFRSYLEHIAYKEGDGTTKLILDMLDLNGLNEEEYFTTKSADFCTALSTKKAILKPEVKSFTTHGAIFKSITTYGADSSTIEQLDAVIICTGFKTIFPFLPITYQSHKHLDRYNLMFHPELSNCAFIGFVRPSGLGSIPPLAEMQSRWMSLIVSEKLKLPTKQQMIKECSLARKKFYAIRKFNNEMLVTYAYYLNKIAVIIGVAPNLFYLFWTDIKLWYACLMKPFTTAQYRLHGIHSKYQIARDIILNKVSMPSARNNIDKTPLRRPNLFILGFMVTITGILSHIPIIGHKFKPGFFTM